MELKDRIDLILEYYEKTGAPVIQDTTYKGFPIGKMLAQIKTYYKSEKGEAKYPKEQLSRLREKGLLDSKIETAIDKAKRVIDYVSENPRIWHLDVEFKKYIATIEDEQEKEKIIQTHTKIKEDYKYLKKRTREGKLDATTVEILIEAGVGGSVFGYPEDTMLFVEKTGFSEKNAQIILSEFGGLNKFREEYIDLMINRDTNNHSEIMQIIKEANVIAKKNNLLLPFVQGFDMSQPNFMASKDDIAFLSVLDKDNSSIYGYFITQEKIYDYINSLDGENYEIIIKKYFALEGNQPVSLEKISAEMNCTKALISDKVIRFRRNLEKQQVNYQPDISEGSRRKFIERFFESNDIFADGIELSEEEKTELTQIYNIGLKEKNIENLKKGSIMIRRLENREEIPIDELNFSSRICDLLKRTGYDTLNKLLEGFDTKSIYNVKGIGKKTIDEIQLMLDNFGVVISEKKGIYTFEDRYIPSVFEKVFEGRFNSEDMELGFMVEALIDAKRILEIEKRTSAQLGQQFDEIKQKELEIIRKVLENEGIEL